ncbi:MAG TPA: aminotransferase class I/II-fold pyridoxal phosphate-dependent enzyme [Saprospiraceae bacterium]|nr:aminotransferase class I/II-fold pyridoxal phosphate-dependent enzyme [Saprospiraceae bacterium]
MKNIIKTASRLGEVKEYYFSVKLREIAEMRAEGKEVLNLGIGSPDLPPPADVIEELTKEARQLENHAYQSYKGIPELRDAFAAWYRNWFGVSLDPDSEILPLIGSKEGIMHISMTYLEAGDEVLVPNPGYPAYRAVANLTGATVREYRLEPEMGWYPDLEKLAQQDLSKVKIMWVNYPNMPTGTPAKRSFFEQLVAFAKKHEILICNDNPYAFILNEDPLSLLDIPGAMDVVLELNSLSKAHNMAGWRVGMIAGHPQYLNTILRFKSNMDSGMFKPVQLAAVKALHSPPSWYKELNAVYRERRGKVFELLDLLGCVYDPEQVGMFVWARVPPKYVDAFALSDEVLYKAHVFMTPGGIFGSAGNGYIRISLCGDGRLFEEAIRRVKANNLVVKTTV